MAPQPLAKEAQVHLLTHLLRLRDHFLLVNVSVGQAWNHSPIVYTRPAKF